LCDAIRSVYGGSARAVQELSGSAAFFVLRCEIQRNIVSTQVFFALPNPFFPGQTLWANRSLEGHMARELQLLAVSLVFVFLGAVVFGLIH
jgi:hypothetical protein